MISFANIADAALGVLYPNVCQLCEKQRAIQREGFVCAECWTSVRFIKPPFCKRCGLPFQGDLTTEFQCTNCAELKLYFHSARSAVIFKTTVHDVILRYKYQGHLWFEPFLADLLIREAAPEINSNEWDCIVPVPLHPSKRRQREFNQAERLAGHLSAACGLPVDTALLKRINATGTQTKLNRDKRAANMKNAFAIRGSRRLNGERILLFDDVFTTGATTNDCARALMAAGAGKVSVWTLARGL